jgi:hypothetical protein
METIKAESVEKTYMVHWECPHCLSTNTHEDESAKNTEVLECWECDEQTNVEWEF